MFMDWNLEERLASQVVTFARHNRMGYSLRKYPLEEDSEKRVLEIELLDYSERKQERTVFRHYVILDKEHQIKSEQTSQVGQRKSDRQAYMRFLSFLENSGIELTNSFEETWLDNPEKYPF